MLAAETLGVLGTLTLEQFLENCSEGPEGDPAEAADYRTHPRLCPAAADDLLVTAFAMARAGSPSATVDLRQRAIGIAAWCVVNHPRDGGVVRQRISEVLRSADRVAITLMETREGVAVAVGTTYARPSAFRFSMAGFPPAAAASH